MKSSLEYVNCNFCGGVSYKIIYHGKPYSVVSCSVCKLSYLNPRPEAKKMEEFYQEEYFESGLDSTGYSDYSLLEKDLELEARMRFKVIKKYIKKGKLLDVGCGYGHFLHIAEQERFKVMGFDISRHAIKQLKEKYNIPGKAGEVNKKTLPKGPFDIITSWDVVEHFPNPRKSFQALASIQKKNGYLFLTTPSLDSIDAKILGKYWYGFKRIPEHLYYFSEKHLKLMLQDAGYSVLQISQWGFYRNIGYFIDQTARYNKQIHKVLKKICSILGIENKTFFFPIIDKFLIAQKK